MGEQTDIKKIGRFLKLLLRISLHDPRDLRHVLGVAANAAEEIGEPEADIRDLPVVDIEGLADGSLTKVDTIVFRGVPASVSHQEALVLGVLLRRLRARRVFEFGTYKGVSTTQMALNVEPGAEILTLDLPDEDQPLHALSIDKASEREIANERGKGSLIPEDLRIAITFLRQDSATFDSSPYASSMDLVFVDGAHSAEYVRNDSEKGWMMLRPGGVIVWHDCLPSHADVVRYVKTCGFQARRIGGTSMAMATKPGVRPGEAD